MLNRFWLLRPRLIRCCIQNGRCYLQSGCMAGNCLQTMVNGRYTFRTFSLVPQLEDKTFVRDSVDEINNAKQDAIKTIIHAYPNRGRYKEDIMSVLDKEDALSDDEINLLFRHLLQKKYFQSILDLTEVLYLLGRTSVLRSSAELIFKAASVQKNIRITTLLANILSPDPSYRSLHSSKKTRLGKNPILEAQQVSTLFAVRKLQEARMMLEFWPETRFFNPVILSSLLSGLIDGAYYEEAIKLYDWCMDNCATSNIRASLRTPLTISFVVQAMEKTGAYERVMDLYRQVHKEKGAMTEDVYLCVAQICDTKSLWRKRYNEMITTSDYKDHRKRQQLQSSLFLEQLYEGAAAMAECDQIYRVMHRRFDPESNFFFIDGKKLGPTELRMQVLILFFNFPHYYWTIEKGKFYVKINKGEDKEQSIEKLLSSDLYPPIRYKTEGKSTFIGGVNKVQTVNYSIYIPSLRRWCIQNDIISRFSVLFFVCYHFF